jgi:hypothetical protein
VLQKTNKPESMQSNVLSRLSFTLKVSNVEYLLMSVLSYLLLFIKMYDMLWDLVEDESLRVSS